MENKRKIAKELMKSHGFHFDWCSECHLPIIVCSCGNNTCSGGYADGCNNCEIAYNVYDMLLINDFPLLYRIKFYLYWFVLEKFRK